jgi:hypothetical protein
VRCTRAFALYATPAFSEYREIQYVVYEAYGGEVWFARELEYADGSREKTAFKISPAAFDSFWARAVELGALELADAPAPSGAAPTDLVTYALAAREYEKENAFAVTGPEVAPDERYGELITLLEDLAEAQKDG